MACKYRSRSFVAVFLSMLICVRVKILPCFESVKKILHFDDQFDEAIITQRMFLPMVDESSFDWESLLFGRIRKKTEVKIGGRSKAISIGLNRTGNAKGRRIVLWLKTSVTSLSRRTAG